MNTQHLHCTVESPNHSGCVMDEIHKLKSEIRKYKTAVKLAEQGFEAAMDRFVAMGLEGPALLASANMESMKNVQRD